jgi:hypothetical protein
LQDRVGFQQKSIQLWQELTVHFIETNQNIIASLRRNLGIEISVCAIFGNEPKDLEQYGDADMRLFASGRIIP